MTKDWRIIVPFAQSILKMGACHHLFGLSRTPSGLDFIQVIVDRFTKTSQFIPIKATFPLEKLANLYVDKIVSQYGTSVSIISYLDLYFTSKFWLKLQDALGTKSRFSIAFHPQIDGQSERIIPTLEDMLRDYVLKFKESWDEHLSLMEFAYNNSYHSSIGITPFQALYARRCRTPACWEEVGERKLYDPKLVQATIESIKVNRENFKIARDKKKVMKTIIAELWNLKLETRFSLNCHHGRM